MSETLPHRLWRDKLHEEFKTGERLEAIAEKHLGIPFEVRLWGTPTLDWSDWHLTLQDFSKRVGQVAQSLGRPPDKVNGEHWLGCAGPDDVPDLVARWEYDAKDPAKACAVMVRAFSPQGCKIDPRSEYVQEQGTTVHPACQAALEELYDLEPAKA